MSVAVVVCIVKSMFTILNMPGSKRTGEYPVQQHNEN